MESFQSHLQRALRKRLYPNAPLHLKDIAGGIGRSNNTVTRWWRGETHVTGEDLFQIALFFTRRGDTAFLHEVFGGLLDIGAAPDSVSEARVLSVVRTALLDAVRDANDHSLWVDASGAIHPVRLGHSDFVRRTLQLPQTVGDFAAYAVRVLGWVAVTDREDGIIVIRHDGRRIAPLAAERLCEWLEDRADRIRHVRRLVHVDGHWIEAQHAGSHLAAEALAKAAFIVRTSRLPWTLKQLPLSRANDPRLIGLLKAYHQSPEHIVTAAAASGALTTTSLFGVHGEDVTSHYVGSALGFDPRTVEGLNVLSRPDTDYGLMLQARILKAKREGPIYYELTGTIDEYNVKYLNLSLPEPREDGRVLSSSVVLETKRIAA